MGPGASREAPPVTAESLFKDHFLALYPPGVSIAELRATDANPENNPSLIRAAHETGEIFARLAPEALGRDDLALDFSDASVHRLSAALGPEVRDRLLRAREPGQPPLLVHLVLHGALYLAMCAQRGRDARLILRNPLWETSLVLRSRAGEAVLSPFAWWLRSLADRPGATLADRYRTLVEEPTLDVDAWPVLAPPDRKLPRLGRVRYDLLYQHLTRHLPELGDFGADFPPPPRFEELGFRFLEFLMVGGGRSLCLHGAGKSGVHLFWLNHAGFTKALFVEADASPEHRVELQRNASGEEILRLTFTHRGEPREIELLWWGS